MVKLKERVRNLFILMKKISHFKSNEIDFKGYNLLSLQNGYKVPWNALWRRSHSISKAIYKGKHYRSKSESNKVLFAKILTCHSSKNAFYLIKSVSLLLDMIMSLSLSTVSSWKKSKNNARFSKVLLLLISNSFLIHNFSNLKASKKIIYLAI